MKEVLLFGSKPNRSIFIICRRAVSLICMRDRKWIVCFLFATALIHSSLIDAFCASFGRSALRRKSSFLYSAKGSVEDEIAAANFMSKPAGRKRTDRSSSSMPPGESRNIDVERRISIFGRQGRTDDAIQLFYSIISQPTLRQINAVIDACARARPVRLSTALDILASFTTLDISDIINTEMKSDLSIISKNVTTLASRRLLEPNVYTYGALMNAISRLGNVELALKVLKYMEHRKVVSPNAVVYQSAITTAANAARSDIALQLLESARNRNIPLTVIGYNAAITAASRSLNCTLAVHILRTMQSDSSIPDPDSVTYGTVMAACESCSEWKQVLQFAEEVDCMNNPQLQLDGMAITSVLKACQQLGYATMAVEYLNRMKLLMSISRCSSDRESLDQQTVAVTATSGRERIGSKQPLQGPDAVAYRLAISACARGGAWQDGIRLLNEYCETVNDRDVIAYTAAITGCEYAGQWMQAVHLLVRMRAAGVQPNVVTFAAVIGACATACANIVESSNGYVDRFGKKDKYTKEDVAAIPLPQKKALQILNAMKKDPTVVDPNIQVYNAAIRTCAEALDMKRAFQLYKMLLDEGLQPNIITYGTLMLACERVSSVVGMNQVFSFIRSSKADDEAHVKPNEIIYGTAISCCRKAGDSERANTLLEKMIRDGYSPNVATINTVLIAQTEASNGPSSKELDLAMNIFKRFFLGTNTETLRLSAPNRQSYSILIRALAANQRPKEAEAFLLRMRAMEKMIPDVDLYTTLVSSYERIGQPLNALRLMESMREDGYDFYDVEVLNTLFKRLVKLVNALGQTLGKGKDNVSITNTLLEVRDSSQS